MLFRQHAPLGMGAKTAAAAAIVLVATGCMTYHGPYGVASTIERKAGIEMHREMGFKLGPISTKIAASLLHHWADDQDYRDLSGIGFAVFEVTKRTGARVEPITAEDLGVQGWQPMFESRSDGDQLLVFGKPRDGEMHEMMLVSIDGDEVVVARLKGHLDRLIEKTLAAADQGGASASAALRTELIGE